MGENVRFWFFCACMWIAAIFAAVMALFLEVNPASAQSATPACFQWPVLKIELDKRGEVQTSMGLVNPSTIVTVFESPDGDTWTMVVFGTAGSACVIGSGRYWSQARAPKAPVEGERDS